MTDKEKKDNALANKFLSINDTKRIPIELSNFGVPKGSMFAQTIPSIVAQKIVKRNMVLKPGVEIKNATEKDWDMSENFTYEMIVHGVYDKDGNRVFGEEHLEGLKKKSQSLISILEAAVNEVNEITGNEIEIAKKK